MRRAGLGRAAGNLHLLEQVQEAAAHFELVGFAFDEYQVAAADVACHAFDGIHIDQSGAMDLPEQRRIELFGQIAHGLADQCLVLGGLHAGVFLVRTEK